MKDLLWTALVLQLQLAGGVVSVVPRPTIERRLLSLTDEVQLLGSKPGVIVISGARMAAANLTVPKTALLRFDVGGNLSIGRGASVTINGAMDAPLFAIFTGPGKVRADYIIDALRSLGLCRWLLMY
eukprot:COSAG01_NODE_1454_length_10256_cov_4.300748_7_plen_127_part_00